MTSDTNLIQHINELAAAVKHGDGTAAAHALQQIRDAGQVELADHLARNSVAAYVDVLTAE